MKKILMPMAVAAVLSACGGSSGSLYGGAGTEAVVPQTTSDTFTSMVMEMAATTSESSEAMAVDSLVVTLPEDTQPMSII
jgi:hypothetical protein